MSSISFQPAQPASRTIVARARRRGGGTARLRPSWSMSTTIQALVHSVVATPVRLGQKMGSALQEDVSHPGTRPPSTLRAGPRSGILRPCRLSLSCVAVAYTRSPTPRSNARPPATRGPLRPLPQTGRHSRGEPMAELPGRQHDLAPVDPPRGRRSSPARAPRRVQIAPYVRPGRRNLPAALDPEGEEAADSTWRPFQARISRSG